MNNRLNGFIILFFFQFLCPDIIAQNLVQDTLTISFKETPEINIPVVIDTVIDARDENESFIGRYEVNKYWIVPVDLLIRSDDSLPSVIKKMFSNEPSSSNLHFKLLIDKFQLNKNLNSYIYPHFKLNSSIQLYRLNESKEYEFIGRLIYESTHRENFFSDDIKEGFEAVVKKWQYDFTHDLRSISHDSLLSQLPLPENYRSENVQTQWINFYSGLDYIYGLKDYLIDGEIYFSDREARKLFYRNGYGIRYRNSDTFESIEFGLSVDYLQYRINPRLIFKLKSQIFIGVNNWKDYKTYEHEIYDAFIGDLGFSQSLVYNPLDKNAFIFGIGIAEDITYIYSKDFRIHAGLLFHLGIKL
jgi:hypothetical protein